MKHTGRGWRRRARIGRDWLNEGAIWNIVSIIGRLVAAEAMGVAMMISSLRLPLGILGASAVALAAFTSHPADARGRGSAIGAAIGIGGALMIMNEAAKAMNQQPRGRPSAGSGSGRRSTTKAGDDDDDDDDQTRTRRTSQQQIIQARAAEDREKQVLIDANVRAEERRNVEAAVRSFIKALFHWHDILRKSRSDGQIVLASINQVTEGEVQRLLEKVYFNSKLTHFDRFAGELWTRDRLMVEVLDEAKKVLRPYFHGPGARGPSMDDLEKVLNDSATEVHARALELSEIVGVSYSFHRFLGTISESIGRVDASLVTTGADARYEELLRRAIDTIDSREFVKIETVAVADQAGLNRQFQFRFRARRALYDCLSHNYVEIMTGSPAKQEAIPAGLIRIQTVRSGATGSAPSRGAAPVGEPVAQRPAGGSAGNVSPAYAGPTLDQQEMWQRLREQVKARCFDKVHRVAKLVVSEGIQPQPARADIAEQVGGMPGGAAGGAQLQPIFVPRIEGSR